MRLQLSPTILSFNVPREYRDHGAHEEVTVDGALVRMDDHRLPKRIFSGKLEDVGQRGKAKEWTDSVADEIHFF